MRRWRGRLVRSSSVSSATETWLQSAWAETLARCPTSSAVRLPRAATFVSAIGGSPLVDSGVNPNEICRRLAEAFRGNAEMLYAPAYAETPLVRDAFINHGAVRSGLERARSRQRGVDWDRQRSR